MASGVGQKTKADPPLKVSKKEGKKVWQLGRETNWRSRLLIPICSGSDELICYAMICLLPERKDKGSEEVSTQENLALAPIAQEP